MEPPMNHKLDLSPLEPLLSCATAVVKGGTARLCKFTTFGARIFGGERWLSLDNGVNANKNRCIALGGNECPRLRHVQSRCKTCAAGLEHRLPSATGLMLVGCVFLRRLNFT